MNRLPVPRALVLCLSLALGGQAAVHADPVPAVWDLTPLYASDTDWETARKALLADLPKLAALKGTLGKSAQSLRAGLDAISSVGWGERSEPQRPWPSERHTPCAIDEPTRRAPLTSSS
jgi:hypothetical protein